MTPIHDTAALDQIRRRLRVEPGNLRRLRNGFYKKHQTAQEAIDQLPESQRSDFRNEVAFHSLTLRSRRDSARPDGWGWLSI